MPGRAWQRPVPLTADHAISGFTCGKPDLDRWLAERALANQVKGATKTHAVVKDDRVVGFYSLANGAIGHSSVGGRVRRNMPDPIPCVILARLAVDTKYGGAGLGSSLLAAAIETTLVASESIGIACLVVHAKDYDARDFYRHFDFVPSPTDPLHLILLLRDVA